MMKKVINCQMGEGLFTVLYSSNDHSGWVTEWPIYEPDVTKTHCILQKDWLDATVLFIHSSRTHLLGCYPNTLDHLSSVKQSRYTRWPQWSPASLLKSDSVLLWTATLGNLLQQDLRGPTMFRQCRRRFGIIPLGLLPLVWRDDD